MKRRAIVLLVLIAVGIAAVQPMRVASQTQNIADVEVLALIGDLYGWPFFDMRDIWEGWGCNVTVVSTLEEPRSCLNRDPVVVMPDVLVEDINRTYLQQFDILYIPSGAHWQELGLDAGVRNMLTMAKEEGLVLVSICWSLKTFAMTYGLIRDVNVVQLAGIGGEGIVGAGGIPIDGVCTVADCNIVSGDNGIGFMGYQTAPMLQTCAEAVRQAMGLSRLISAEVSPATGVETIECTFSIQTAEIEWSIFNNTAATAANATLRYEANSTVIASYPMTNDGNGEFSVSIEISVPEEYALDVIIVDENTCVEVARNVAFVSVDNETSSITTTAGTTETGDLPLGTIMLTAGGLGVAAIVILAIAKGRTRD